MDQKNPLQTASRDLTGHRRPLHALTGIRFFAALYVVVFHSRISALLMNRGLYVPGNFFANGYLAVPLFFLLSGFILAYTYAGQIETSADRRRFWEARFARIWPLYALSLVLSSVPSLRFPPPSHILAALCMVQAWNPFDRSLAGAWNFVCWTLSVEAFFYLCFPRAQTWVEKLSPRALLLAIGAMLLFCVAVNSAAQSLGTTQVNFIQFIPLPVVHLGEFFTGVGLGNLVLRNAALTAADSSSQTLPGRGSVTYLSALVTVALLCRGSGQWTSLVVIGFSGLIFSLASENTLLSRFLSTRGLLLGGGVSYSIYLMQMPVKAWGEIIMTRLHIGSPAIHLGVNTILLLVISLILFETVEQPVRRLLRFQFAHFEQRRQHLSHPKRTTI
jgi:peptidoglycan/LPS O-acetylase OafA/YrhL